MSKLKLIVSREYLSRVKKPSFFIFAIILPLVIASLILTPIVVNKSNFSETTILIQDETTIIGDILVKSSQNQHVKYKLLKEELTEKELVRYDNIGDTMVLRIPDNFIKNQAPVVELFNKNAPGIYVVSKVKDDLYDIRKKLLIYSKYKFDLQKFEKNMNSPVSVIFQGQGLNPELKFFIGLSSSLLLYFLITMFGVQVMKSGMEEKSSRIVEVIVSSVKPKTLLKGKIFGIGLVGISQLILILGVLCVILVSLNSSFNLTPNEILSQQLDTLTQAKEAQTNVITTNIPMFNQQIVHYIASVRAYLPIVLFVLPILFFLGFYLYATLFAAVGALIDNDTDTQQFILPITLPLVISGSIAFSVLSNPTSELAFWASIFPLTSPVVLPARLAFMDMSQDWWQILLSISLLIITAIFTTKACGKIYKTGILMYGQKTTLKNVWKWLKQK